MNELILQDFINIDYALSVTINEFRSAIEEAEAGIASPSTKTLNEWRDRIKKLTETKAKLKDVVKVQLN